LLLWVFYSSAIFLFGAEVTRAYAVTWGTRDDLRSRMETPAKMTVVSPQAEGQASIAIAAIALVSVLSASLVSALFARNTHRR
jgi:membrane protein